MNIYIDRLVPGFLPPRTEKWGGSKEHMSTGQWLNGQYPKINQDQVSCLYPNTAPNFWDLAASIRGQKNDGGSLFLTQKRRHVVFLTMVKIFLTMAKITKRLKNMTFSLFFLGFRNRDHGQ